MWLRINETTALQMIFEFVIPSIRFIGLSNFGGGFW